MKAELRRVIPLLLLLGLGACDFYYDKVPSPDDAVKLVPWFDHMIESPAFHPYERADIPRRAVPGTVPIHDWEPDWAVEWGRGDASTADRQLNPLAAGELAARGDTLYTVFCGVCHGPVGDGRGPVGPRVGAPSLLTEKARALTDGNIYSIIRYGRGVMPLYGDKIVLPAARWAVVSHVRGLQSAGGTN